MRSKGKGTHLRLILSTKTTRETFTAQTENSFQLLHVSVLSCFALVIVCTTLRTKTLHLWKQERGKLEKTGPSLKSVGKKAAQERELTKGRNILVRVPGLLPKENRRLILVKKDPSCFLP